MELQKHNYQEALDALRTRLFEDLQDMIDEDAIDPGDVDEQDVEGMRELIRKARSLPDILVCTQQMSYTAVDAIGLLMDVLVALPDTQEGIDYDMEGWGSLANSWDT